MALKSPSLEVDDWLPAVADTDAPWPIAERRGSFPEEGSRAPQPWERVGMTDWAWGKRAHK